MGIIFRGESPSEAFQHTVELAQLAEQLGYHRFWYPSIMIQIA